MKHLITIALCILTLKNSSTKPKTGGSTESTNNSKKINIKGLVGIDITKNPKKAIDIADIANIEYIPLETNDSTLVRFSPDAVSKKDIIYHNPDGQILIFNRQGKRLYSFNHSGGGPEEYNSIYNVILDEDKEELYIGSLEINTQINVYSINGKFKRRLILPKKIISGYMINYDKDHLFFNNYYFMDISEEISGRELSKEDVAIRDNPYFFISKQTRELIPLDYYIPNRMGNRTHLTQNAKSLSSISMNILPLAQNTLDILISDFADDTLYSLKNKKLLPIMIKKPSAHKMTPPMLVGVSFFTNRYVFIDAVEKKAEGKLNQNSMVYDKKVNDFYQLNLLNKDDSNKRYINLIGVGSLHNTSYCLMYPDYLLQAYSTNKLKGELKEIASKLIEDDNPVLMLIKFKE
ncbi:6-bladed beta-propeller [Bacteroides sp.]|uniref:6-bladed beta-propeller n=1 Tax=Bacteroides sp. TaxID=29523 RepID=UPI0026147636|nr:6-bladed beta-propeller [Bacteroides sp.]MDD3038453.1 6-bladed beta-propeller [Bacteroides sp.]